MITNSFTRAVCTWIRALRALDRHCIALHYISSTTSYCLRTTWTTKWMEWNKERDIRCKRVYCNSKTIPTVERHVQHLRLIWKLTCNAKSWCDRRTRRRVQHRIVSNCSALHCQRMFEVNRGWNLWRFSFQELTKWIRK